MKGKNIFIHASEHSFLLSSSEILMLRNYARSNKFKYCSQIGGSESMRDIQEAKNMDADAFEFKIVESLFSISKQLNSSISVISPESQNFILNDSKLDSILNKDKKKSTNLKVE